MILKFSILTISVFLFLFPQAKASSVAKKYGYESCNHHKFTFAFLKVYDVYLCANEKGYFEPLKIYQTDFSLVINYDMNFDKDELSKSSIEEMNRYYQISEETQDQYYQKLLDVFPNVKKGDVIEAKYNKLGFIDFYHNQSLSGKIENAEFSKRFLDIWLFKDNKYQKMTKDLFLK
ncbi:MAG: hypothetical protein ACJA0S_000633 [Rickettsiales bacterium]|jgi:hypothetical protein